MRKNMVNFALVTFFLCRAAIPSAIWALGDTLEPVSSNASGAAASIPVQEPIHHQEMLKKFDTNGDGMLSDAELAAAHPPRGDKPGLPPGEMKKYDTNGDGTLSADELAAAQAQMQLQHHRIDNPTSSTVMTNPTIPNPPATTTRPTHAALPTLPTTATEPTLPPDAIQPTLPASTTLPDKASIPIHAKEPAHPPLPTDSTHPTENPR